MAIGLAVLSTSLSAQDLKPEEIVVNHLNSIGTPANRGTIKTLMAIGLSEFETKVRAVKGGGRAVVVSDSSNLFFAMSLNSRDIPLKRSDFSTANKIFPISRQVVAHY